MTNSQRYKELKTINGGEANASSSGVSQGMTNSQRYEKIKMERAIGFDTLQSDLNKMNTTYRDATTSWHDADYMGNVRNDMVSMQDRLQTLQQYSSKYGVDTGYTPTRLAREARNAVRALDDYTKNYGYYKNEDAFNVALQQAQLKNQFSGLSFEQVQEELKKYEEDSEEYKYLSNYTDYSNLTDFDKAMEYANLQIDPLNASRDSKEKQNQYYDLASNLEMAKNKYELDHAFDGYAHYMEAEDFDKLSQYETKVETRENIFGDERTFHNDKVYEYINNMDGARERLKEVDGWAYDRNYAPHGYDHMTEDEIAVYNYIYATEGKEKAQSFLDEMEATLTRRSYLEESAEWKEFIDRGAGEAFLANVFSVPANLFGAIGSGFDTAVDFVTGREYNPYSYGRSLSNISSDITQYTSENIADTTKGMDVFGVNVPSFLYQTGMSTINSAVGVSLLGAGYTPIMGMSAYQQKARELTEAGASQQQILFGALAAGAIEIACENIGIDNLFKIKNTDTKIEVLKNAFKQAGVEAGEESLTETVNLVVDWINMQDESDIMKQYNEYRARGFSEREASVKVALNSVGQVTQAGLGGALSGGAMGGTYSAMQYGNLSNMGAQISANDRAQDMMSLAQMTPEESEAYQLYTDYANKNINAQNITNAQLGNLYATTQGEAIDTFRSTTSTENQKVNALQKLSDLNIVHKEKSAEEKQYEASLNALQKGEDTTVSGKAVDIVGMKKNGDDTVIITSNGEVPAKDMTFSSSDAEIVAYAENMSEEKGNLLLSQYDGNSDVQAFVDSFNLAYEYGRFGFSADRALQNKGVLTEKQASAIYTTAIKNVAHEKQKAIDAVNQKYAKTAVVAGAFDDTIIDYNSATKDGSKVNWNRLTQRQRSAVQFAKAFSRVTGVNITFSKEGMKKGFNGFYNPENNTITLDVYAGIDKINAETMQDSIIPTLSHELTHWMKDKAPAMYQSMRDHVLSVLTSDGKSEADLVDTEVARIKKNHPDMDVSDDMAIDELIARACEDMLSNSNTARKLLARMSEKEQKSFVDKVKAIFKSLMDWVNDLLGQYKSESAEAKFLRGYKDKLKELSQMWDKALEQAIQTSQNLQKEEVTAEALLKNAFVQYSDKIDAEMDLDATVEQTDDLIAVHNLTEKKLEKSFQLEGFPMPSIAITKASIGHTNFGDISLVFTKDTINPANRKNKVYGADAWTPTFPAVEYEADTSKIRAVADKIYELSEKVSERYRNNLRGFMSGIEYNINSYGGYEGVVDRALNDYGMKQAYLAQTDDAVEDITTEKRTEMGEVDIDISERLIEAIGEDLVEIAKGSGHDIYEKYGDTIKRCMKEGYVANGIDEETAQSVLDATKKISIVHQLRVARNYMLEGGVKTETITDVGATQTAINNKIDEQEYEAWVRNLFDGIVKNEGIYNGKEIFTPSGNRKSFAQTHYPITAQNIVKAMMAQSDDVRNVSGFNGIKSIRAVAVKEFRSIKDIREARGKLKSIDSIEYESFEEGLANRLYDVMGDIRVNSSRTSGNPYIDMDTMGYSILDACANPTAENVKKLLNSYEWKCTDAHAEEIVSIIKAVKDMPVNMFEAKPQRVVPFSEIAYALIPDNASENIRNQIKEKGIPIREYASGDDNSRMQILNSEEFAGIRFSDRDTEVNSIKEQLRNSEGILNSMEVVANVTVGEKFNNKREVLKWVTDMYNKIGYAIERQNFGKIVIDEKRVDNGLRYLTTQDEFLAYAVVPHVLRRGIEIGKHNEHKGRDYTTVTFGAPVIINGIRENVAVVIRKEGKNYYKTHRVVMADDFDKKRNNAERAGGVDTNSGLSPTDIASKKRLSQKSQSVNSLFSDRGLAASGNTAKLTDERIEYLFREYGASDPKYAQAYISSIHPRDYLRLTISDKVLDKWNEAVQSGADAELYDLDVEKLRGNTQTPYLCIDTETGEVTGHEGRHRMRALLDAGITSVPVVIIDTATKYSKVREPKMSLLSQDYGHGNVNDSYIAEIQDLIPLNEVYREEIIAKYGGEGAIRYSDRNDVSVYEVLGENASLEKRNRKLMEDVERLTKRLKLERQITNGNTFNENQLGAVAGHLLNISTSTYGKRSLIDDLRDVYSYIAQTPDLAWDDVFIRCYEVASNLLDKQRGTKVTNDYFKAVLSDIRNTRISLSEEQVQEARSVYGEKYRNAFMGRVMITKDGISLDQMWQEWAYKYPDIFKEDVTGGDQITALSDIYDSLREGSEVYEMYNDTEAKRAMAIEVYNQYWNVSTVRTMADKHDAEIKRLNFEHRKAMGEMRTDYKQRLENQKKADAIYYGRIVNKIRKRNEEELKRARELGKKRMSDFRDRAEKNAKIQSITNKALTLNKWLTKNSKDEHIPEVLKTPVAYLLNAIDFSSKQLLGLRGGSKAYSPTKKDISLSKALEQVHDMVRGINSAQIGESEITEIYGTFADFPAGFEDDVKNLSTKVNDIMRDVGDNAYVLNEMSVEELDTLERIITTVKATVTQMNKFLAVRHAEGVANMSQQSMTYLDSLGKGKVHEGLHGKVDTLVDWGNALPYYTFKRFGEGGMKVYEALMDGWDKFAFHVKRIIDYAEAVYNADEVKNWSEDIREFDVLEPATDEAKADPNYTPRYQKVKMSVPQIMSLYCLQKREQAKSHLMGGGMRVSDIQIKKDTISQSEGVILGETELVTIISSLSDRQKKVADELQLFMNTTCTGWGNEVSMLRFGYKAFGEENYFPIQSDKNNLAVNDETEQNNSLFRLLNMSFTKSTITKANNRIVISNIFDVFAQHTSDMAKYNALALPILDSFKWYNYKEKIQKGDTQFNTKSLKQSLENAFGKDAQNYITTFLRDINGEQNVGRDTVGSKFFTNAKLASVGFNLRVIALQPTSYVRASAIIDPKYLIQAFAKKPNSELAEKYCGIAVWKSLGFYDTNIQKGVADLIKHEETLKDKVVEKSMKGAEMADRLTWGYLWNACEAEVRAIRSNLIVGSEVYYEAVANRLREIIYATQVVDSTMTRSQMMRSNGMYDKILTAFGSEPTLAFNMLQDAYYDWKLTERQTGSSKVALKKHGKRIARTITAYTVTNMLAALVEAGFDALREEDKEDMNIDTFMEMFMSNFKNDISILGKIPYAKEMLSMLEGFSSSRTDTQWMQYTVYTINGVKKILEGDGNAYTTTKNALRAVSYLSGIPFYNAWRDSLSVTDTFGLLEFTDVEDILNDTVGRFYPSLKTK